MQQKNLFHDYRKELLPTVIECWDQITVIEKERMNNFFCGLHYVVGLAECDEETLKVWEASAEEKDTLPSPSSSTQRLIRTACTTKDHNSVEAQPSFVLI